LSLISPGFGLTFGWLRRLNLPHMDTSPEGTALVAYLITVDCMLCGLDVHCMDQPGVVLGWPGSLRGRPDMRFCLFYAILPQGWMVTTFASCFVTKATGNGT
jgi:hypothetical protein